MMTVDEIDRLRGEDFQQFCSVLLSAHCGAFQAVDGTGGDEGNDGVNSGGTVLYQMYAPKSRRASSVRKKIDESLLKAAALRGSNLPNLREFRFLTSFNLTSEQLQYLQVEAQRLGFAAESWGNSKLYSILLQHPEVRGGFPETLLPDIVQEIRGLQDQLAVPSEDPLQALANDLEFGPYTLTVLQRLEREPLPGENLPTRFSDDHLAIHVRSDSFSLPSIEPGDEDAFCAGIHDFFWEDAFAEISRSDSDSKRLLVQHRDAELRFHRVWGRWTNGTIGMATTLRCCRAPEFYSLVEVAVDAVRFLQLCARFSEAGDVSISLGYDPNTLKVLNVPSDGRILDGKTLRLEGIESIGRQGLVNSRFKRQLARSTVQAMADHAHLVVGDLLVPIFKDFHLVRLETEKFKASIPHILAALREVQTR